MSEIPGTLREPLVFVHPGPSVAAIIGTIEPAFFRFDERINTVGVAARDRDASPSENSRGQAFPIQVFPGVAAIDGLVKSATGTTAGEAPWRARTLPESGEEHIGIVRIEGQVNGASLVILEQNLLPGLAAIAGAEDAAVRIGAISMAERGNIDKIRIARMNQNSGDVLRVVQANVGPGFAAVSRFVYAIAIRDVAANAGLSGTEIDHGGVGLGYCDCAN